MTFFLHGHINLMGLIRIAGSTDYQADFPSSELLLIGHQVQAVQLVLPSMSRSRIGSLVRF